MPTDSKGRREFITSEIIITIMVAADTSPKRGNNNGAPVDMSTRPTAVKGGAPPKAFLKPSDPNMLGFDHGDRRMSNLFVDYKHQTGSQALGASTKGKMSYSVPSKSSKERRGSTDSSMAGSSSVKKSKGSKGKSGKSKNDAFMGTWTHGFKSAKDDIFMTIWYRKFLRTKHSVTLEPLNM